MRKIDKTKHLSTVYFDWLNTLPANTLIPYDSPSIRTLYYKDVLMNLLHCQQGVCAYTEIFLADSIWYAQEQWNEGKYLTHYQNKGQLDHFDPTLKTKNGWDWDNFFVVDSDTNMKIKSKNRVDNILKPDLAEYAPNKYLVYNWTFHMFIPNPILKNTPDYKRVLDMINTLGLNFQAIVDVRRVYLKCIEYRIKTTSDYETEKKELYQFFTAYEMSEKYLNRLNNSN